MFCASFLILVNDDSQTALFAVIEPPVGEKTMGDDDSYEALLRDFAARSSKLKATADWEGAAGDATAVCADRGSRVNPRSCDRAGAPEKKTGPPPGKLAQRDGLVDDRCAGPPRNYGQQPPRYDDRGPPSRYRDHGLPPRDDDRGPLPIRYNDRGPPPPRYDDRGRPPSHHNDLGPPPPRYDDRGTPLSYDTQPLYDHGPPRQEDRGILAQCGEDGCQPPKGGLPPRLND